MGELSLDEALTLGHGKMRDFDYPCAIVYFKGALGQAARNDNQQAEILQMIGVCERCIGGGQHYKSALNSFREAFVRATTTLTRGKIKRDEMMVYLERDGEGDKDRAHKAIKESIELLEVLTSEEAAIEHACSVGFRGRYKAKFGDTAGALTDFTEARWVLRKDHKHYLINNDVHYVKALCADVKNRKHRYLGRLYALRGITQSLLLRHDGKMAGGWIRAAEFAALLLRGNRLHHYAALLKKK